MDNRYPLDVTKLRKGDDISESDCSAMIGMPSTDPNYNIKLIQLRDEIEGEAKREGMPLSIITNKKSLHINTDPEASEYHRRRAELGRRQIFRENNRLRTLVDTGNLNEHQKAQHDRNLFITGMMVAKLQHSARRIGTDKPPAIEQEDKRPG